MSYMGNWCIEPAKPLKPCDRDWKGRGPMFDKTTNRHDYVWKSNPAPEQVKYKGQLCIPKGPIDGILRK